MYLNSSAKMPIVINCLSTTLNLLHNETLLSVAGSFIIAFKFGMRVFDESWSSLKRILASLDIHDCAFCKPLKVSLLAWLVIFIPAFHDCVGNRCDGCINLANPSNNGLANVITYLDSLYVGTYDGDVSRADFWQLAGISAIEQAVSFSSRNCNSDISCDPGIVFKWGREDCTTSPTTAELHIFPGATMSRSAMMNYFSTNYGFDENEVMEAKSHISFRKIIVVNSLRLLLSWVLILWVTLMWLPLGIVVHGSAEKETDSTITTTVSLLMTETSSQMD